MGSLSAFEQPQKLIDRAVGACAEADRAFRFFIQPDNFATIVESEGESGYFLRKVVVKSPPPDVIEERITDAINNAKNSFDQILFAACDAIDKRRDGHYPWVDEERLLQWKLEGGKSKKQPIPSELWDVIRTQEPYPRDNADQRGDTLVRSMATLANNKHTLGTTIGCNVASFALGPIRPGAGFNDCVILWPQWDPVKNEIVLARWKGATPHFEKEATFTFHVTFDLPVPHNLREVCAISATRALIEAAQRNLDALKARAAELGAT
jgi:hypothetical protein